MKMTIHLRNMPEIIETAKGIIKVLITGTIPTLVHNINPRKDWRGRDIALHHHVIVTITPHLNVTSTSTAAIVEITPLLLLAGNRPHLNEAMITDSRLHHVPLRTIENVSVIMTGGLLLPVLRGRGCTSHPLPMRGAILHLCTIGAVHRHLWVRDMNIRQEKEKVRIKKITWGQYSVCYVYMYVCWRPICYSKCVHVSVPKFVCVRVCL